MSGRSSFTAVGARCIASRAAAMLVSKDGRLCAAAFVQNRKSYTGCTDAPNPSGESGRPWCYVEAQVSMFRRVAFAFS